MTYSIELWLKQENSIDADVIFLVTLTTIADQCATEDKTDLA